MVCFREVGWGGVGVTQILHPVSDSSTINLGTFAVQGCLLLTFCFLCFLSFSSSCILFLKTQIIIFFQKNPSHIVIPFVIFETANRKK